MTDNERTKSLKSEKDKGMNMFLIFSEKTMFFGDTFWEKKKYPLDWDFPIEQEDIL